MKTINWEFKRFLLFGALIVCLFWGLQNIKWIMDFLRVILGAFSPVILGMVIAFVINMPMKFFEDKIFGKAKIKPRVRRALSLLISFLLIVAVIFVVTFMVAPQLGKTVMSISDGFPQYYEETQSFIIRFSDEHPQIASNLESLNIDEEKLVGNIITYFQNLGTILLNSTVSMVSSLLSKLLRLFLGIIFSCYMLINKETFKKQSKELLFATLSPSKAHNIISFLSLSAKTFHNFIAGQCTEAVILGMMFTVSMALFSFPYALLIGVLIAFTALIPIVGTLIGCGVGVLLMFMESPATALWFAVLFFVLQQVEGNFIYPRVVGNSVGLPSMWVLIAVTVGGTLMGIWGMLIFIPIFSIFYTIIGEFVKKQLKNKQIDENTIN